MKTLANCKVTKLREYSQSYGSQETINVPFIQDFDKYIILFNSFGSRQRTMRKGTKVLISFSGKEITERTFQMRSKKNLKLFKERIEREKQEQERKNKIENEPILCVLEKHKEKISEWIEKYGKNSKGLRTVAWKCQKFPGLENVSTSLIYRNL